MNSKISAEEQALIDGFEKCLAEDALIEGFEKCLAEDARLEALAKAKLDEEVGPVHPVVQRRLPRVPVTHSSGLNVNFCKKTTCQNFGIPIEEKASKGPGAVNRYTVVATGKGLPAGKCNCCGEIFPLKSNNGVFEEFYRLSNETFEEACCPNQDCSNHRVGVSNKKAYFSLGKTAKGSQRYKCKECNKILSVKPAGLDPLGKQENTDKNELLFELLMGKSPMRRIVEITKLSPKVVYERIDFLYEQAQAVLAHYESKLPQMPIKRLYIGVDQQEYAINWSQREDKKNVILNACAMADNSTNYVFSMHTNFDPSINPEEVDYYNYQTGEENIPAVHRRYARLWLPIDFKEAMKNAVAKAPAGSLTAQISKTYEHASKKVDIEEREFMDDKKAVVAQKGRKGNGAVRDGMLVHSSYTLHGAFQRVAKLFANTEKVRFFLDQDSGMRSACFSAFANRIKNRSVDAFFVSITKDQTVDEKRKLVNEAEKKFKKVQKANPDLDKDEIKLMLLKNEIQNAKEIGEWKDRWVKHPLPTIYESEKASCFLTDMGDYDEDHQAWLHNKASLHAVDSWFNRVRRRSSLLERPVKSAANFGRSYYAYSAYRPEQVAKILTIMRVCHNFIWIPSDLKKNDPRAVTPAMRLGFTTAPLTYNDVINFKK